MRIFLKYTAPPVVAFKMLASLIIPCRTWQEARIPDQPLEGRAGHLSVELFQPTFNLFVIYLDSASGYSLWRPWACISDSEYASFSYATNQIDSLSFSLWMLSKSQIHWDDWLILSSSETITMGSFEKILLEEYSPHFRVAVLLLD